MDYLETTYAKPKLIGRYSFRSVRGVKPTRKVDTTPRYCECGKKLSVYNTNADCFACATRPRK